jgi:ComF family protein
MLSNRAQALSLQAHKIVAATARRGQDCLLCLGASEEVVCAACAATLPRITNACARCAIPLSLSGTCGACLQHRAAFDDARALFEYRFPLDRLVQRFKFSGDLATGEWLARRLADELADANAEALVAPPLAATRLRERGFNQALEIAKVVSRARGIPLFANALRKVRETEPQPGLTRAQRSRNLDGAFRSERRFEGLHVCIVDDVLTTGATADALARVLKEAGARRVSVWAVARTPAPGA